LFAITEVIAFVYVLLKILVNDVLGHLCVAPEDTGRENVRLNEAV